MAKSIILVLIFVGAVRSDMSGECDMAGFYLELGCTPSPITDNSTQCPDTFSCPELHPDPKQCYYRGVAYNNQDLIPQSLINNPCSQLCMCDIKGTKPRFQCAAVDCVETFDSDAEQQCIYTYQLEECCYTGLVCGRDAVAKLRICEVDGQTYLEGQTFEPKNTRKTCICTAQWNGSLDSSCRDINCGIEIHYQDQLLESCAPVFASTAKDCPISFVCPTQKSKIIRGLNARAVKGQCMFGNMTLAVGDEVTVEETCTICKCLVPPFVSCTKQTACT